MTYSYSTADQVAVADERTTLEAFLDHHRHAMCDKVRGVSDEDAARQLVPSATTLAGLIKHLRRVEASWFAYRLAQQPVEEVALLQQWLSDGPDSDFRLQPGETVASLVAHYERQCEISRKIAAGFSLDHVVPHDHLGRVSLRWIYVHMIEETARHLGHADILREQLDGAVGG